MSDYKHPDYDKGGFSITKFKSFRGHDGDDTAYQCDIKYKGKVVCKVLDDGWGGGLQYDWLNQDAEKDFNAHIKTLPQWSWDGDKFMDTDADIFVGHLVSEWEFKKKITRLCKTKTLISFKGDDAFSYRTINVPYSVGVGNQVRGKYPQLSCIWNEVI